MQQTRRLFGFLLVLLLPMFAWATPSFDEYFERHSAPMWMIDTTSGDIVRANAAAYEFYGYDDLEQRNIRQINLLTPAQIEEEIARASERSSNHLFMRHRLANGNIKVVGINTQRHNIDGREVLISSIYDTSEFESSAERHYIKSVEQQVDLQTAALIAAERRTRWISLIAISAQALFIALLLFMIFRLRKAKKDNEQLIDALSHQNRDLERLGHAMAHHFQEPSRRLISFSQQLKREVDAASPGTAMAVHYISTQSQRLSELVADVQRYLSLGTVPPVFERLDTLSILQDVYQTERLLDPMRLECELEIATPLPRVYFDKKQLSLIFKILLHNAWQYRCKDRPLRVVVSGLKVGDRVRFRVEDNGQGVAPEYREQIFDMFSRLVPNSEEYPGTGMGLALVAKALRKTNGRISIEDGPQGGACFIFDLPSAGSEK
ncbi:PAS domain-containing sensor histidine kinase [Halomonas sp. M1]|uniref:sensor histidine kinase n=1 Tax=Halomonas sp. M1 TaxID=3035470 RepID=UPI0024853EE7|nr:PAS domain-containing sensor histidine kinase [Halomonas sp. M1]WFE70184.1 PAS domain-containing sensor histidine kinase [Halomonas sp. M1]